MKKFLKSLIIVFCFCSVCFAIPINEKYSYKDFLNKSFKEHDVSKFNNTIIIGSCFYQEGKPDKDIFPEHLENVEFKKCNLDNVLIKEGMIVDSTNSIRKIYIQNDLEDWIVEKKNDKWVAKEPLDKNIFIELGISIDPLDIPCEKQDKSAREKKIEEINNNIIIP